MVRKDGRLDGEEDGEGGKNIPARGNSMCKDRKRQSVAGGRPGGAGEQEDAGRPLHSGLVWGLFSGSCSGLGCRERGTEETLPGGATQVRVGTRDSSSSQQGPGLLTEKEVPAPQKPHQLSPLPPPPGTPPLLSEKSPVFFFYLGCLRGSGGGQCRMLMKSEAPR